MKYRMSNIFVKNVCLDGSLSRPCIAFACLTVPYDVKYFVNNWIDEALQFHFNEITIERYSKTSDRVYTSRKYTLNNDYFNKQSLQDISESIEDEITYVVENPKLKLDCVYVNLRVV